VILGVVLFLGCLCSSFKRV